MVERSELRLVDSEAAMVAMLEALESVHRVGIDTEFHAEHRYRPELMLVQIAAPDGRVFVVDPRATSLQPLAALLERSELVLHGGSADVELLQRATGRGPRVALDTQRAAGLLGQGYPSRLGAVALGTLGVALDKGAGLTDWSVRPLSVRQLQYAAVDARILLPLAEALERRLAERGRLGWAREASAEIVAEASPAESTAWMGWDIAGQLDEEERRALHALFQWRDATGRALDQPPRGVLSDGLALDLARRRPLTLGELVENRRIPQGLVKRHGAALLGELRRAREDRSPPPSPPSAEQLLRASTLELWATVQEREQGIARALALPRSLALRVATEGASALQGWRAEALGAGVADLLGGRSALAFSPAGDVCAIPR